MIKKQLAATHNDYEQKIDCELNRKDFEEEEERLNTIAETEAHSTNTDNHRSAVTEALKIYTQSNKQWPEFAALAIRIATKLIQMDNAKDSESRATILEIENLVDPLSPTVKDALLELNKQRCFAASNYIQRQFRFQADLDEYTDPKTIVSDALNLYQRYSGNEEEFAYVAVSITDSCNLDTTALFSTLEERQDKHSAILAGQLARLRAFERQSDSE